MAVANNVVRKFSLENRVTIGSEKVECHCCWRKSNPIVATETLTKLTNRPQKNRPIGLNLLMR